MDLKITPKKPEQLEKERVKQILTETPQQARNREALAILKSMVDNVEEIQKTKEEFENSIKSIDNEALLRNIDYVKWFETLKADVYYYPQINSGNINFIAEITITDKIKFNGSNFEKFVSLMRESDDFQINTNTSTGFIEIHYVCNNIGKYTTNHNK